MVNYDLLVKMAVVVAVCTGLVNFVLGLATIGSALTGAGKVALGNKNDLSLMEKLALFNASMSSAEVDGKQIGYGPMGGGIVFGVVAAVAVAITAHDSIADLKIV